jgi:hypothetical protein
MTVVMISCKNSGRRTSESPNLCTGTQIETVDHSHRQSDIISASAYNMLTSLITISKTSCLKRLLT